MNVGLHPGISHLWDRKAPTAGYKAGHSFHLFYAHYVVFSQSRHITRIALKCKLSLRCGNTTN